MGPRGGRASSAAAAADGPTWPKPAARLPEKLPDAFAAARGEIEKRLGTN